MRNHSLAMAAAALLFLAPQLPTSTSALAAPQGQQGVVGGVSPGGQAQPPAGGRQGQGGRGGGGRGRQAGPPPGPAPRNADGRVLLGGATLKETGLWTPRGVSIRDPLTPPAEVPFQDWARALHLAREEHELEPHTRCKASGVARQFMTPYGVEFVELPELQRIYIFDVGGPHTYRTVYMDGRSHPKTLVPTYYGHSIGWWESDTLVIDTVGFNEDFWLDRRGLPHTEKLHTIERFTRTDANTIRYEVTIDDPGAYTAPWKGTFQLGFARGQELFEYVCQQANQASELMVGDLESVDRSSSIIP